MPDVRGVDGAPLRLVTQGSLAAVTASLPADEFGAGGLEEWLKDLDQLERLARSHNEVVDALHARTTVLPMRLATVYLDDARLSRVLRERAEGFGQLLDRLDGQVEMGVKVYATPAARTPAATSARGAEPQDTAEGESPGRAYLRRRQAHRRHSRDVHRTAGEVAARLPRTAAPLVRARAVHRPQQGELAPRIGENVANEAYLVARSDVMGFRGTLEGMADGAPGVHVEVTGPWAPYSFADGTSADGGATQGAPDD
ncbi:gas vesicle protein [Streptomyces sp. TS71-3]|nr:gas vesicle protein [Streptomyces sp. TS71-3]